MWQSVSPDTTNENQATSKQTSQEVQQTLGTTLKNNNSDILHHPYICM